MQGKDTCFYADKTAGEDGRFRLGVVERDRPGYKPVADPSFSTWVDAEADAAKRNINLGLSESDVRALMVTTRRPSLSFAEKDALGQVYQDQATARGIADDLAEADHRKQYMVVGNPGHYTILGVLVPSDIDTFVGQLTSAGNGCIVHVTPKRSAA